MQYCVITGEQHEIYRMIDAYFDDVQRKIDSATDNLEVINPNLLLNPHFERRRMGLCPLDLATRQRPDDAVHLLLYKDKVAACVTEQRTGFNNVQFSFFSRLEEILGEITSIDREK